MKIMFLDIDGVLTSKLSNTFIFMCPGDKYDFNPYCIECLKHIEQQPSPSELPQSQLQQSKEPNLPLKI